MKKLNTKKLTLDRETVIALQADAMDAVVGGNISAQQTQLHCETNVLGRTCLLCVPDPVK